MKIKKGLVTIELSFDGEVAVTLAMPEQDAVLTLSEAESLRDNITDVIRELRKKTGVDG